MKNNYVKYFEALVFEEKKQNEEINLENEEKKKNIDEEIKKYEDERKEWMNICNRYKIIREDFEKY